MNFRNITCFIPSAFHKFFLLRLMQDPNSNLDFFRSMEDLRNCRNVQEEYKRKEWIKEPLEKFRTRGKVRHAKRSLQSSTAQEERHLHVSYTDPTTYHCEIDFFPVIQTVLGPRDIFPRQLKLRFPSQFMFQFRLRFGSWTILSTIQN